LEGAGSTIISMAEILNRKGKKPGTRINSLLLIEIWLESTAKKQKPDCKEGGKKLAKFYSGRGRDVKRISAHSQENIVRSMNNGHKAILHLSWKVGGEKSKNGGMRWIIL